jgi:uncharacterized protein
MSAPQNPVRWFEIHVQDMDRAKAFYERVFARSFQQLSLGGADQPEIWAFSGHPDGFGAPGALVKMAGVESGGNSVLVYFSSDDCAVEHARALEAGGQSIKAKTPIPPFGFIALVRDPDGNRIGIHSMA